MVDEAKAFCPACGNAFVEEEQRAEASKFDQLDGTMQLGQTMYNQMLSDMGLNISAAPDKPAEPAKPAAQVIKPAAQPQILQPAVSPPSKPEPAKAGVDLEPLVTPRIDKRTRWIIAIAVAALGLFVLIVVAFLAALAIWRYTYR